MQSHHHSPCNWHAIKVPCLPPVIEWPTDVRTPQMRWFVMDFSVWVNLRLDPVRQSFKVLPRAKKAAHKEAVFSHYAHWWLSMCLHHLQDLLMLQLVLQPHGRAMGLGWMGWLPPCTHHPSPRGYHATPLALLQLTSRTIGVVIFMLGSTQENS